MAVSLVLGGVSCEVGDPAPEAITVDEQGLDRARAYPGLHYGNLPEQILDLYLPVDPAYGRSPVILFVHGGAWQGGDNDAMLRSFGDALTAMIPRGWAVGTMSYRTTQEAPHPAQVQDVKRAVRWIRTMADRFSLDRDVVVLSGHSAGGHLALLAGMASEWFEPEDWGDDLSDQSSRPTAVVALAPVVDVVAFARLGPGQLNSVRRLIGCPVADPLCDKGALAQLMPLAWADRWDPPVYLAHGDVDSFVPFGGHGLLAARVLEERLGKFRVWFDRVDGSNHDIPGVNGAAVATFLDFVRRHALR